MASREPNLGAFFADRARRHEDYLNACIHLAGK
jgi:hypothetical protein